MIKKENLRLPFLFSTENKKILIIGGGKVAERKLTVLLDFFDSITLIAPKITNKIKELHLQNKIMLYKKNFNEKFITENYDYVFIATDNGKLNNKVALICKKLKIPTNIADNPDFSDFHMPAIISDVANEYIISISTHGKNPAKAKKIKEKIMKFIDNGGLKNI